MFIIADARFFFQLQISQFSICYLTCAHTLTIIHLTTAICTLHNVHTFFHNYNYYTLNILFLSNNLIQWYLPTYIIIILLI